MGCLEKIQLNQVLIQKFMKSFLSASNAYDMYHVGVWFRTLSYHSAQIFPTSEGIPKQARTKLTKKFIRQFFKKTIRYKTAARRKDGEDYILWKLEVAFRSIMIFIVSATLVSFCMKHIQIHIFHGARGSCR